MCLGKRLEVNIYMHILLFFTNPLLQPKIKRIRFDPGLGSHLHAFGPKSWPKRIGNRPFPPSFSLFLPLPPFPPFSSHWWEFFFLKILTSGKYFFLTSGMNFLSHWWEFDFIPLVRTKSFPLVRIPQLQHSGVSIYKRSFDQLIIIRECEDSNFKTLTIFIFFNFNHLPFF